MSKIICHSSYIFKIYVLFIDHVFPSASVRIAPREVYEVLLHGRGIDLLLLLLQTQQDIPPILSVLQQDISKLRILALVAYPLQVVEEVDALLHVLHVSDVALHFGPEVWVLVEDLSHSVCALDHIWLLKAPGCRRLRPDPELALRLSSHEPRLLG